MTILNPCPFCGREAILESNKLRYGTIYSAYCQKCGAEIARFSEHEAISAWNRRTGKDINVPTNADRIRSLSDEELAVWLVGATVCERVCDEDEYCHGNECVERVTRWLKQPAKEEHNEID